jgi:hypothetical protein
MASFIVTSVPARRDVDSRTSSQGSPSTPKFSSPRQTSDLVVGLVASDSVLGPVGGGPGRNMRIMYGKMGPYASEVYSALAMHGGLGKTAVQLAKGIPKDAVVNKAHPYPLSLEGAKFSTVKVCWRDKQWTGANIERDKFLRILEC